VYTGFALEREGGDVPTPSLKQRYFKRTGICFSIVAAMIVLILLKGLIAGAKHSWFLFPMLFTPPLFLLLLWQAYSRSFRAFLELPSAPAWSKLNLPEALFVLALIGAFGIVIGLTAGYMLGKAVAH
jgi:hypothetical protein